MINVDGAVLKGVKTLVDKSIVATIDFGELVKLGDFDGLLQMPIRVIIVLSDEFQELESNRHDENQ